MARTFSNETIVYLRMLYATGHYSVRELSQIARISVGTVSNWVVGRTRRDVGGPICGAAWHQGGNLDHERAVGLAEAGWTSAAIARHLKVSIRTVQRWKNRRKE